MILEGAMSAMAFEQQKESAAQADDSDAHLVQAAQRDIRAFAPLYEAYFDAIYGYTIRSLRDPELAADATSETFAKALKALPRYRARSFRSWLFTIAHNVVIDTYRRRRPTDPLDETFPLADEELTPEEHYLSSESAATVARLLAELTGTQRQVVELRMAGLTGQEIADVLGTTVGAVKAAQFRAYSRLRDMLTPGHPVHSQERHDETI